jgi:gas vesicle protein
MLALRTLAFVAGCTAACGLQAQNPDIAFKDGCSREPPEVMRPVVIEKLGELEAALSRGDLEQAERSKLEAEGATQDVAGWTGALGVKCVDEPTYRRYFEDSQEVVQLRAGQNPADTKSQVMARLWIVANDSSKGPDYILEVIPDKYNQYSRAWYDLNGVAETVEYYREIGAFVLPEEAAIERAALEAAKLIDAKARERSRQALAREVEVFYRDPTQIEMDGAQQLENLAPLASSMAGIEVDVAAQTEYQFARQRTRESREQLDVARGWAFSANSENGKSPANLRAAKRGDEVMTWADNEELSFTIRDQYYELALDYYNWCNCKDKAANAFATKEAIQPQLLAEQTRRQEQIDQAEERLKGQAKDMQRAIDDMQKTDAEKKAFEDEADALEAELGF